MCGIALRDVLGDKAWHSHGNLSQSKPGLETHPVFSTTTTPQGHGATVPQGDSTAAQHGSKGKPTSIRLEPKASASVQTHKRAEQGGWVVLLTLDPTNGVSGFPEKVRVKTQEAIFLDLRN